MSPLPTPDMVYQIIFWLREAGKIALSFFENVGPTYKPDQTFVTKADLEIESYLAERIEQTFPKHGLVAEESIGHRKLLSSDVVWVIDPLDGTTAFSQGLPGWGIAVGALQQGEPVLGFYYMPLLGDLTYTSAQGEVFYNNRHLTPDMCVKWEKKGFLAITTTAHADFQIHVRHTRALGSHHTNLIYTARGTATAALLPKAHVWDLVAGAAIMRWLGGELCYLDGTAINYNALLDGRLAPQPIVAGHATILKTLSDLIHFSPTST